jgi:hypothetical protein
MIVEKHILPVDPVTKFIENLTLDTTTTAAIDTFIVALQILAELKFSKSDISYQTNMTHTFLFFYRT